MWRVVDDEVVEVDVDRDEEYAALTDCESMVTLELCGVSSPRELPGQDGKPPSDVFDIEFKVVGPADNEYKGKRFTVMTDCRIGPGNRTRRYIEAFLGRPLEPGERFPWSQMLFKKPRIKAFVTTIQKTSKMGTKYEANVVSDKQLKHGGWGAKDAEAPKSANKPKEDPFNEDD
jgi:hypothetical protein